MKKTFLFAFIGSLLLFSCNNETKKEASGSETTMDTKTTTKPMMELLDMSTTDGVKNSFDAFSRGDIDGFTAGMADNVRFTWSSGDSLIGKQAVKDYYNGRWKLIDSMSFTDHIFVPLMANEQQSQYAPAGKWVLHWAFAHPKYKNGKRINFWVHDVNHYNEAGKIDFIGQYIDRHQLMEATKGMMAK